jgi:uncharacterized protein (TIGR04255 family)
MELLTKSPLIEASCEIIFMPSSVFDTTLPGILYTELKDEFPTKKDKPGNMIQMPSLTNEKSIDLTQVQLSQFFSIDEKQAVQIGKDILVNNMLTPYKGWGIFKAQILKVFNVYCSNLTEQPKIRRITLKYINIFSFDINADYQSIFTMTLPNPPLKKYVKNRAFNTVVEYDTEFGDILSLGFKSIYPQDKTKKSILLEINSFHNTPKSIEPNNFENWLNIAHKSIEDLFIASLKKQFLHSIK